MTVKSSAVLEGLCLLSTRPSHQQAKLKNLLEADGARVLSFPSIEITGVAPSEFHIGLNENISRYQMLIFVSRNAVDGAFQHLDINRLTDDIQLAVIGEGTFSALAAKLGDFRHRIINGQTYNSEGLLDTGELNDVGGKNILIFRGQEGRNLLGDTLRERGALVDYCEVYRRKLPDYEDGELAALCAAGLPDMVIFTSSEGMQNLFAMNDEDVLAKLLNRPWLLISERMRESAVNLGHNAGIIIARKASDAGIHQAIREWALKQ